jgi:hypothetical protein
MVQGLVSTRIWGRAAGGGVAAGPGGPRGAARGPDAAAAVPAAAALPPLCHGPHLLRALPVDLPQQRHHQRTLAGARRAVEHGVRAVAGRDLGAARAGRGRGSGALWHAHAGAPAAPDPCIPCSRGQTTPYPTLRTSSLRLSAMPLCRTNLSSTLGWYCCGGAARGAAGERSASQRWRGGRRPGRGRHACAPAGDHGLWSTAAHCARDEAGAEQRGPSPQRGVQHGTARSTGAASGAASRTPPPLAARPPTLSAHSAMAASARAPDGRAPEGRGGGRAGGGARKGFGSIWGARLGGWGRV